eukprot:CAMPEP_0185040938 /NCGR_PEP_ID=MMETSP1103-20130426/39637_1 /TAXON_ID=36769 /ORGANISM="Paraphysomonas bandaiensis, Strain Caron Lab Isolate" /LENGTH=207 /DNA_ID=CAMNT_0027580465 /DNA_START=149 /DNA_END=769 /DNA_ORIENTATION=-
MKSPLLSRRLACICIGRLSGPCIVASASTGNDTQHVLSDAQKEIYAIAGDGSIELQSHSNFSCGNNYTCHYNVDSDGIIIAVVADLKYPPRVAFSMVDEVKSAFMEQYQDRIFEVGQHELDVSAHSMLTSFLDKYEDLESIDAISSAQQKLEAVKGTMSENITLSLQNLDRTDKVMTMAEDMNKDAMVFKRNAKTLRERVCCRAYKW